MLSYFNRSAPTAAVQDTTARSATLIVAASDASPQSKLGADYVCDGTSDDEEISTAIAALPSGGGKVALSEGTFRISASIDLADSVTLEGAGRGTTTITQPPFGNVDTFIRVNADDDCRLAHFTIDGLGASQGGGNYLVHVTGASLRTTIEDLELKDAYGFGIFVSSAIGLIVRDCIISGVKEKGINLTSINVSGVRIQNCDISTAGGGSYAANGVEIDDGAHECTVTGNLIHNTAPSAHGVSVHNHSGTQGPENIAIVGNVIKDVGAYGVNVAGATAGLSKPRHVTIVGNTIENADNSGISVARADHVSIANNIIIDPGDTTTESGIRANKAKEVAIAGNIIRNSAGRGIQVIGGRGYRAAVVGNTVDTTASHVVEMNAGPALLASNILTGPLTSYVILIGGSAREVIIEGNVCRSTSGATAIEVRASRTIIRGNSIEGGPNGITLLSVDRCVVEGNECKDHITDGIRLSSATHCVVVGNSSYGAQAFGIRETGSADFNTIIGNDVQVDPIHEWSRGLVIVGAHTKTSHNIGYMTENRGIDIIADGETSKTIPHGLAAAPASVIVTPTGNEFLWVSGVDATNITISRSGTSGSRGFYWYAEL